jgi:Starch-binding associating with outer membrane
MKKINIILSLLFLAFLNNSCESLDLEGQVDPNSLPLTEVDANLLLTDSQVEFSDFFYEMSDDTRPLIRMVGQFGTYASAADPQESQNQWSDAYANILKNGQVIAEIAKTKNIPHHLAISKILEAYTMVTMVDFYGDVPYSEAILGNNNLNPKVDSGASIYDAMLMKLDEAIVLLGQNNIAPLTDLYYTSSPATANSVRWVRLANSLKIKIYNNLRLTRDVSAEVNAIVASGKIMLDNNDDFNFKYSTASAPVDSRHPDFTGNYFAGKAFYMSNSYMRLLTADKTANVGNDPRRRNYFYRQTASAPSGTNLPCATNPNIPICYIGGGLWGRDHADNTGIPNDNNSRTIMGLYPAGGKFDNSNNLGNISVASDRGANGAGVLNILDYSFVQFQLAELALTEAGVTGNPAALLSDAVSKNITKVLAFGTSFQGTNVATAANILAYNNEITSDYAALANNNDRLNYIIKESFIAYWGNGLEPYNAYRRTGFPRYETVAKIGMQPPVIAAGDFVSSFFYPKNAMDNNKSLSQHLITKKVFWDNNPAILN